MALYRNIGSTRGEALPCFAHVHLQCLDECVSGLMEGTGYFLDKWEMNNDYLLYPCSTCSESIYLMSQALFWDLEIWY